MIEEQKQKVLVVDDELTNVVILAHVLSENYDVETATTPEEALHIIFSDNKPDLVLLDIMLPGMDGYEICSRMKHDPQTMSIPIIFISAKDNDKDEEKGLRMGAVDYITKPFSLPIVQIRVKNHLELKKHRDRLEELSAIDPLTGIPNRRSFEEKFQDEWRRALRTDTPFGFMMIDIDFFKNYNDTYGHPAGDDCLVKVAHTLKNTVHRSGDYVARIGGEEFACLLPNSDTQGALHIAQQIQTAINALQIPHENSAISQVLTLSIGLVGKRPTQVASKEALMDIADKNLYQAKKNGRNQIVSND
jgi:diguanylate cyclase (GGDEF)-like protein